MPINNFHGNTFVAFTDISGFKELMHTDENALQALRTFYQAGYDVLHDEQNRVEGFFVSDCGILFAGEGSNHVKLRNILRVVKKINKKMLLRDYMLTTSFDYVFFDYQGKLEFSGIAKNPIYGNAYLNAFMDNEKVFPKIQPGQCRIIMNNLPDDIDLSHADFCFLVSRTRDSKHRYYYWNVAGVNEIEAFEKEYQDSYKLKFAGMLKALRGL